MAFQTLCKRRFLGEGEAVPLMVDGHEVLVVWPDGAEPRAFAGVCPHERQSLVNNSEFDGRTGGGRAGDQTCRNDPCSSRGQPRRRSNPLRTPEGLFIDWNGQVRRTTDCGGGHVCEVDPAAKYVGILTPKGTLMHEATFCKDLAAIEKAGIMATLVPGSTPWGRPDEGL